MRRPDSPPACWFGPGAAPGRRSIESIVRPRRSGIVADVPLPIELFVLAAVLALAVPIGFVGLVAVAWWRQRATGGLGPGWEASLAAGGGLALGSLLVIGASDVGTAAPILGAGVLLGLNEWRSRRLATVGWLLAGLALPWTVIWGLAVALAVKGGTPDVPTALRFALGALPLALGLVVAGVTGAVGSAPDAAPNATPATGPVKPPRDRSFLVVAHAIRSASWLGPIPLPELAAVTALALVGLVGALLTAGQPALVRVVLLAVVGSALASEAYLRAMASATRRSMEAFSWLGDAELREIRQETGGRVPTTAIGARRWLASHPASADEPPTMRGLRVQVLLLAGRAAEAAAVADALPADEPAGTHERLALRELVGWWLGEPSRVPEMQTAEAAIQPAESESRLRAHVATAIAEVRRRAVDDPRPDPESVLRPLVEARDALGTRADDLLRRTLWRPVFALFLLASLAFGLVGLVSGTLAP